MIVWLPFISFTCAVLASGLWLTALISESVSGLQGNGLPSTSIVKGWYLYIGVQLDKGGTHNINDTHHERQGHQTALKAQKISVI